MRPQISRSRTHFPRHIFHTEGGCATPSDNYPIWQAKERRVVVGKWEGPRQVGWENIFPVSDQTSAQPGHYLCCCSLLPSQVSVMTATTTVTP